MEDSRYQARAACARFDAELEAFMEGEARPFVASHGRDCAACGALLADLAAIRQAALELPQEEPSPLVWTNLRAQLTAEKAVRAAACAQFEAELQACLEGETRPLVAAHARECAACGALLEDLQAVRQAAQALPLEEPSPAVWTNLRAQLAAGGAFRVPACAQFEAELADYLEGEARPLVPAHARECAACGAVLADIEALRRAASAMPREEPSPFLWTRLCAQLAEAGAFGQPVAGWRQILSWRFLPHLAPVGVLAGLVVMASVLILPSLTFQHPGGSQEGAGAAAATQVASALPPAEDRALAQVVSDLESSFKANEALLTPDLKATYDKSLVSLDGSIRECLDSLQREPGNTLAHDYLLAAYTRKAEVLSSALEFQGR